MILLHVSCTTVLLCFLVQSPRNQVWIRYAPGPLFLRKVRRYERKDLALLTSCNDIPVSWRYVFVGYEFLYQGIQLATDLSYLCSPSITLCCEGPVRFFFHFEFGDALIVLVHPLLVLGCTAVLPDCGDAFQTQLAHNEVFTGTIGFYDMLVTADPGDLLCKF